MQPASSRVLAAANRFRALVEARAHRPALSPEEAARQLRAEAGQKWFDEDAVAQGCCLTGASQLTRARAFQ